MLLEHFPILHTGSRLEISQQFRPVVSVGLSKQFDEPLALPARWGLLKRHLEQDRIPPAHLVVTVITDQPPVVAQRNNLLARHCVHAVDDLRVPHIPPGRPSRRSDVQHGRECHVLVTAVSQDLEITPSAYCGETPSLESLQRALGPQVRISVMLPCCIRGVRRIEIHGALADATDAERKEPLAVGSNEPGTLALLLD